MSLEGSSKAVLVALWATLASASVLGCDADCSDPKRIDGTYGVWSNVASTVDQISGENVEEYPLEEVFFNGWSTWEMTYIPSQSQFQLYVDGQPFVADYSEDPANCNAFTLAFSGTYEAATTAHEFQWSGELTYMGSHLGGTWTYQDAWTGGGITGSIDIPRGELNANLEGTGFQDTAGS